MTVLLMTASALLHDRVVPRCAAVGVGVDHRSDPTAALATWSAADLVLVGEDLAPVLAGLTPPRRPGVHLVAVPPTEEAFRAAVELGAESVLDLDAEPEGLSAVLADVGERASPGRVVGVVGGAGGAGATTLACALAQWWGTRGPTLLVDADPLGPGTDRLLGLEDDPGVRWEHLVGTSGRLGARELREAVPRRGWLGVLTWAASGPRPDQATVGRVLAAAVRGHDLVVLDLPRHAGSALTDLAERCDDLLVATPATVPGLAATARLVADLGVLGRAGLVLRPGGVGDADAERVTGLPVLACVRDQRGLGEALDRGAGPLTSRGPLARAARTLLAGAA